MSTVLCYTVQSGDTYYLIAKNLSAAAGVSYQAIEAANPNYPAASLAAGDLLVIPAAFGTATALTYTVMSGDTWASIATGLASCVGMTATLIEAPNHSEPLYPGMVLAIPAAKTAVASAPYSSTEPVAGFWWWTYDTIMPTPPASTNLSIAFSGAVDVTAVMQSAAPISALMPGARFICLGGGGASTDASTTGYWTKAAVEAVTTAITAGQFAGYQGIAYDIEIGALGLTSVFQASFAAAQAQGFAVLVTVSHTEPYTMVDPFGPILMSDADIMMRAFFADSNINILSPQLYTSGSTAVESVTSGGIIAWADYATSVPSVVPSIPYASNYAEVQAFLEAYSVPVDGYIQWEQTTPD